MGFRYDLMRTAAWRRKGEDWRNTIVAFEIALMIAPWALLAAALAGVGLLARRAWQAAVAAFDAPDTTSVATTVSPDPSFSAVPGWLWIAAVFLLGALFWIFRPGQIRTSIGRRSRTIQVFVVVIMLAGIVGLIFANLHGG